VASAPGAPALHRRIVAAAGPPGTAGLDLVGHRVGQCLDRGGVLDADPVAVEEDVQSAQAQLAVAAEQGEASRAKGAPPEPDGTRGQRRKDFVVRGGLPSPAKPADPGEERFEDLLQFEGYGVTGFSRLVQLGVELGELLGQRLPPGQQLGATSVWSASDADGEWVASASLGHGLVPRTVRPCVRAPLGVARPDAGILTCRCDILRPSGRFDVDSPRVGAPREMLPPVGMGSCEREVDAGGRGEGHREAARRAPTW
jgi:hypothetical protein